MDSLFLFEMGFVAVVTFVLTSALYTFIVTPKAEQELEEELEEALELIDDQQRQIKSLLRDNKRMLATLNHYNIKKAVPLYPTEEAKRDGRR